MDNNPKKLDTEIISPDGANESLGIAEIKESAISEIKKEFVTLKNSEELDDTCMDENTERFLKDLEKDFIEIINGCESQKELESEYDNIISTILISYSTSNPKKIQNLRLIYDDFIEIKNLLVKYGNLIK